MSSATTEIIANAPNISRKVPIPLPPQFGGSGSSSPATGTGTIVLQNSPSIITPNLGTPSAVTLTHGTGLVPSSGLAASGTPSSSTFLRGDNTWASTTAPTTGSWTPAPGTGSGVTFSSISAGYTKIANLVFAYTYFIVNSTADTSNIVIIGLPFTAASGNYTNAPCTVIINNSGSTHSCIGQVSPSTQSLSVLNAFDDSNLPWTFASTHILSFMAIYSTI